jgi:hypothetical protein
VDRLLNIIRGESIPRYNKTFLPLFLLIIFGLSSSSLTTMALMPAALKNDNKERDLLLKALIAPSLSIGIISY